MSYNLHIPHNTGDASKLVSTSGDGKYLAGGQSLLPTIRMGLASPSDLVSLQGMAELAGIKVEGNTITIGAMTTHAAVAANADVKRLIPALAALAGGIGDRQVRNRGTIGGSLANSDPAACYPAGVLGLGATINTDKRKIAGDEFFKGLFETALQADELITSVSFPVPAKAAYMKFKNPASRFAIVGVMVSQGSAGTRVAVTGAGACAFRVAAMEAALGNSWNAAALDGMKAGADKLNSDLHASAAYRAHLIGVMARRAVAAAK